MQFYRALYAFYKSLLVKECDHLRVNLHQKNPFCPDCGYKIKLVWTLAKCRGCGSKRVPKKDLDGHIVPMHKYCRYCGAGEHRLVKKDRIEAHEIMYAVSLKEVDYTEERQKTVAEKDPVAAKGNPFLDQAKKQLDIVEGEVIRKRYVSQGTEDAWKDAPFGWQDKREATPRRQHPQLPEHSSIRQYF